MKKIALLAVLILSAYLAFAQKFEFPPVTNTVPSVETAFLALLHNMVHLSQKSSMFDHIEHEAAHEKYIEYINFILNNMTYEKVKSYFGRIAASVRGIDYQGLSRGQHEDFEHFLNTAIVDSWTFGTGLIEFVNIPSVATPEMNNEALIEFTVRAASEQKNIEEYERQLKALPSLESIQKAINDAVSEYENLRGSNPKTARAVQEKVDRLPELKNIEMNARRQYREISSEINSLNSRISSANSRIRDIAFQREEAIKKRQREAEQDYIKNLHDKINNFYVWRDFFDTKNEVVKEYLSAIDVRNHLSRIIRDEVPQRQENEYKAKLEVFCSGWGL
ncbi:MAG: hypothetical protein LBG76_03650 [Treponema sp.]|jgi:predicted  nucleic acid-binding Zn-ribbon protein|nr:hypothetical protein [Treponema sp.]